MLLQLLINGIISGSVIALISLGFALVYNTTRIFHVAYAVLFMFSPYMFLSFHIQYGFNLWVSVLLAIVLTILLSLIIEIIIYKPIQKKKGSLNQLLISSIGIMIIIINLIALFYGNENQIINPGISDSISIGVLIITNNQFFQLIISLLFITLFFIFLKFSRFGLITRALRDDEYLSMIFAVNITALRLALFALSANFGQTDHLLPI